MKVLFIFPHPDDETIFASGIMSNHIQNGDDVVWVCASFGERGGNSKARSPGIFYDMFTFAGKFPVLLIFQKIIVYFLAIFRKGNMALAEIRKQEAEKVAQIIGISDVIFWNVPDMRFNWNREAIKEKIKMTIDEIQPAIVYTMHPNGITGHPDHVSLSNCVTQSLHDLKGEVPYLKYVTFSKQLAEKYELPIIGISPDVIAKEIVLSLNQLEIKLEALRAYESQSYLWRIFLDKNPELLCKEFIMDSRL